MKNLLTRRPQMVGSARRETQKAHRIIPEGKCDGGGIGEDGARIIEGRQAKGAIHSTALTRSASSLEVTLATSKNRMCIGCVAC